MSRRLPHIQHDAAHTSDLVSYPDPPTKTREGLGNESTCIGGICGL